MNKYKWFAILLNLVLLLIYINYSVVRKETLLKEGQLILLELAPVDPRSLMQGDYMDLRYKISENLNEEEMPKRGYCVVQLDSNNIGHKVRFQKETTPLNAGEYLIEYTAANAWSVNIGAESFFFQEGEAKKYEKAKFGGVRIVKKGDSRLVGLYDEQGKKLE